MEAWIEGKVWRNGNMVTTMLKTEEYQGWIWKFQKEEAVEIVARVHSSSLPHALHPKNSCSQDPTYNIMGALDQNSRLQ